MPYKIEVLLSPAREWPLRAFGSSGTGGEHGRLTTTLPQCRDCHGAGLSRLSALWNVTPAGVAAPRPNGCSCVLRPLVRRTAERRLSALCDRPDAYGAAHAASDCLCIVKLVARYAAGRLLRRLLY